MLNSLSRRAFDIEISAGSDGIYYMSNLRTDTRSIPETHHIQTMKQVADLEYLRYLGTFILF